MKYIDDYLTIICQKKKIIIIFIFYLNDIYLRLMNNLYLIW